MNSSEALTIGAGGAITVQSDPHGEFLAAVAAQPTHSVGTYSAEAYDATNTIISVMKKGSLSSVNE